MRILTGEQEFCTEIYRVANGYISHGAASGHDDAGQVEAEDDGGRPSKEVKFGELIFQWVENEAATRIRTWSAPGYGTGTRAASSGSPAWSLV